MYLRWQSRRRERYHGFARYGNPGDITWAAVLVESVRVDGKPRQRHIAYLGSFSEDQVREDKPFQRIYVWEHMLNELDALGDRLTPKEREKIEAELTMKIGRNPPSKDEIEETYREAQATLGEIAQRFAGA
jgi:hypothetical protein